MTREEFLLKWESTLSEFAIEGDFDKDLSSLLSTVRREALEEAAKTVTKFCCHPEDTPAVFICPNCTVLDGAAALIRSLASGDNKETA